MMLGCYIEQQGAELDGENKQTSDDGILSIWSFCQVRSICPECFIRKKSCVVFGEGWIQGKNL